MVSLLVYLEWGPINGQERKVVGISMKKPGGEFCFIIMDRFIYTGIFIPSVVKKLIELFMLFSANFMPLNLILKMELFCTLFMGLLRL